MLVLFLRHFRVLLALSALSKQYEQVASILDVLLERNQLILGEVIAWGCQHEHTGLLDLVEVDLFLVQTDLNSATLSPCTRPCTS